MARLGRVSALALVLAVGPAGAFEDRSARADAPRILTFAGRCSTVDPARISGPEDERAVLACTEGLTRLDPATAQIVPGAAESWTVSPDGKTWTFKLRPATWQQRVGGAFKDRGPVKASDFVTGWLRLLDMSVASPQSHILDALPGVSGLSTDAPKGVAINRIVEDLTEVIGGAEKKQSLSADQVEGYLSDPDRNARVWLADIDAKEVREFLAWKEKPYAGPKAWALIKVLKGVTDVYVKRRTDAEAHVGVDRAFFAKDDQTFVVMTRGPAPWLLSLLARGPLAPVNSDKIHTTPADQVFRRNEHQVCNGAFVAFTDFPRQGNGSGDATPFKLTLFKNPTYWRAAEIVPDKIVGLIDNGPDEVLRQYSSRECQWVLSDALTLEIARGIRAAKAPGWKPSKPETETFIRSVGSKFEPMFRGVTPDAYDVPSGRVYLVRLRCAPPLDTKEPRQALAAVLDRAALALKAPSPSTPLVAKRFVSPGTTGAMDLPRVPAFDASKATATYGKKRFAEYIDFLCDPDETDVANAIAQVWKKAIPDEASVIAVSGVDRRSRIAAGQWVAALDTWIPAYDDPLAYLSAFTTKNTAGACAWSSPLFDALIAGATDVAGFKQAPDKTAAAVPAIKAALEKAGDEKGLENLRRVMLAEAESILLEEAVVVPLWTLLDSGIKRPEVKGVCTDAACKRAITDPQLLTGVAFER